MHEYTWTRRPRSWFGRDCWIEIESPGAPVGLLKVFGFSAIAGTPVGPYSFRAGGLDRTKGSLSFSSFWKRQIGHDATVLDLATNDTVGTLSVTPLHNRFTLPGQGQYDWGLSFLGREGRWKS